MNSYRMELNEMVEATAKKYIGLLASIVFV